MIGSKEKIESLNPNDVRAIQALVVANSFENIKFGNDTGSISLSDGALISAIVYAKKDKPFISKKPEIIVDVDSANPVPSLEDVTPFIWQLLSRERDSFTVRTGFKDEWIAVRFVLSEPHSVSKGVGESRDSIQSVL